MLAYITQNEAEVLRQRGGGVTDDGGQLFTHGIPAFYGDGGGGGGEGEGGPGEGSGNGAAGTGDGADGGAGGPDGSPGAAGNGNGDGEGAGGSPGDGNGNGNGASAGDAGAGGGGSGGGDSANGYLTAAPVARAAAIDPVAAARQRQLESDRASAGGALRSYFDNLFGQDSDKRRAQGFYDARSGQIIAGRDAAIASGVAGMAPELQASPLANEFARGIREQAAGDMTSLWTAADAQNAQWEAKARGDFDTALGRIGASADPWGAYNEESPKFQGAYNDAWAIPDSADPFNGIESGASALPTAARGGADPADEAAATTRLNDLVTNASKSARTIL